MKVILKRQDGVHFIAETETGHTISVDGSEAIGGQGKGARPMEMVLVGLGGCSAIDVMSILKKSRQQVSDCTLEIDAQRADSVPAVFSKIHLLYQITGTELDRNKVERAVSLSVEKYCSVTRMLEKTAEISYQVKIVPG